MMSFVVAFVGCMSFEEFSSLVRRIERLPDVVIAVVLVGVEPISGTIELAVCQHGQLGIRFVVPSSEKDSGAPGRLEDVSPEWTIKWRI